MPTPKRNPAPSEHYDSHAEIILQRYRWLLKWALQLTGSDRSQAEDLVQDAFVHFTFTRPDLFAIQNLEAYLYQTLRNLHLSQMRRAARIHFHQLSVIEYESAQISFRAREPQAALQVLHDLRRICQYACQRKDSSKSGSVLILRFFHGYHLSEIALVARTSRQAVGERLKIARQEVKTYLDDPSRLSFMGQRSPAEIVPDHSARTSGDLLTELRCLIFESRKGDCLPEAQLGSLYHSAAEESIDSATLGHVISCEQCLDAVNQLLDLPLLAERFPVDMLGPDARPKGGPGDGQGGVGGGGIQRPQKRPPKAAPDGAMLRCYRWAQEVLEHQPHELCIAVNGHLLASQAVGAELIDQTLNLTIAEPIDFIEILSEQDIRLLLLEVDKPPGGAHQQSANVDLSDGRTLTALLSFDNPWPTLQVIYYDPLLREAQSPVPYAATAQLHQAQVINEAPMTSTRAHTDAAPVGAQNVSGVVRKESILRIWQHLCMWKRWRRPNVASASSAAASDDVQSEEDPYESFKLIELGRAEDLIRGPLRFWRRPGLITVIVSAFLIAVLLFVRTNNSPTITALNLLKRASVAEDTPTSLPDQVAHRVINLEERDAARGTLITQRRVETWQSAARGVKARRLYDEQHRLIAGEWTRKDGETDGSRTIYRSHSPGDKRATEESAIGNWQSAIGNVEIWQLEPSAKDFTTITGNSKAATVEEGTATYVLTYKGGQPDDAPGLVKATLTLEKGNLHAIEQTLVVQHESELREYRFTETSFARHPSSTVVPSVFEPETELLGRAASDTETRRRGDTESVPASPHLPVSPSPPVATPELEVEVAYLLDQFRARFGDQINLIRTLDRTLLVQGVVDTNESKDEILRALSPVSKNPAIRIQVSTAAEALQRQRGTSGQVSVRQFSGSDHAIPAYHELRRYFSREAGSRQQDKSAGASSQDDRVDQAVRGFAAQVVSRSRGALSHAIELRQLTKRFSAAELDVLTPNARAKWLSMVRDHTEALHQETSLLRGEVQPIFFPTENAGAETEGIEIFGDADLASAIERLYKSVLVNDEAIRSALTASSDRSTGQALNAPRFRLSLARAERLAERIRQTAAKE